MINWNRESTYRSWQHAQLMRWKFEYILTFCFGRIYSLLAWWIWRSMAWDANAVMWVGAETYLLAARHDDETSNPIAAILGTSTCSALFSLLWLISEWIDRFVPRANKRARNEDTRSRFPLLLVNEFLPTISFWVTPDESHSCNCRISFNWFASFFYFSVWSHFELL